MTISNPRETLLTAAYSSINFGFEDAPIDNGFASAYSISASMVAISQLDLIFDIQSAFSNFNGVSLDIPITNNVIEVLNLNPEAYLDFDFDAYALGGLVPVFSMTGGANLFDYTITITNDPNDPMDPIFDNAALVQTITDVTTAALNNLAQYIVGVAGSSLDIGITVAEQGATTVASAGSNGLVVGSQVNGVFEVFTRAQIELNGGGDGNGADPDIVITINSDFLLGDRAFTETADDRVVPAGDIDYVSVLTHEIFHGLGFFSFRDNTGVDDTRFDLTGDGVGDPIESSYGLNVQFALENGLLTPRYYGQNVVDIYGEAVILESTFNSAGSDISHFASFNPDGSRADTALAIENPSVVSGDVTLIAALELAVLRDIGFNVPATPDLGLVNTFDGLGFTPTVSAPSDISSVSNRLGLNLTLDSASLFTTIPSSIGVEITTPNGESQMLRGRWDPNQTSINVELTEAMITDLIVNGGSSVDLRLFYGAQTVLANGTNEQSYTVGLASAILDGPRDGTALVDVMTGTNQDNVLNGLAGDDIINGNDGDDTISGGLGADTLSGGLGNDIIYADSEDVFANLTGGADIDTLYLTTESLASYDYAAQGFEMAIVSNAAADILQSFSTAGNTDTELETFDVADAFDWGRNVVRTDVSGTKAYASLTIFYLDGTDAIDVTIQELDSGNRVTTDFDAGDTESYGLSILTEDANNDELFTSVLQLRNDANEVTRFVNTFDNALDVTVDFEFVTVGMIAEDLFDIADDASWSRKVTNVDDSADGSLLNYQTAEIFQNTALQNYGSDILLDTGVREFTDNDLDGSDSWAVQITRTDIADAFSWGTIIDQRDASGNILYLSQTNEGSYDTIDVFDVAGSEVWARTVTFVDDENDFSWSTLTFFYDDAGTIYDTVEVPDGG